MVKKNIQFSIPVTYKVYIESKIIPIGINLRNSGPIIFLDMWSSGAIIKAFTSHTEGPGFKL